MVVEHSWRGQTGGAVERETCRHVDAANDRVLRYFRIQRSRNHGSISLLGPGLQQEDPQEREERMKIVAGEGKKSEILGGPAEGDKKKKKKKNKEKQRKTKKNKDKQ